MWLKSVSRVPALYEWLLGQFSQQVCACFWAWFAYKCKSSHCCHICFISFFSDPSAWQPLDASLVRHVDSDCILLPSEAGGFRWLRTSERRRRRTTTKLRPERDAWLFYIQDCLMAKPFSKHMQARNDEKRTISWKRLVLHLLPCWCHGNDFMEAITFSLSCVPVEDAQVFRNFRHSYFSFVRALFLEAKLPSLLVWFVGSPFGHHCGRHGFVSNTLACSFDNSLGSYCVCNAWIELYIE